MSKRWQHTDGLRVTLQSFSDLPMEDSFAEAFSIVLSPEPPLNIDELADQLESAMSGRPYAITDTRSHVCWGAEGTFIRFVIDTSSVVGGIAGLFYLLERICSKFGKVQRSDVSSAEEATSAACDLAKACLQLRTEEIHIESVRLSGKTWSVKLRISCEVYTVQIREDGKLHLRKLKTGKSPKRRR